jgi:CRISPR system Cascade subunit CasB
VKSQCRQGVSFSCRLTHVAGVSESRVTKLLVSRGEALVQNVPLLVRLLASRQVKPNWFDLSELILKDQSADPAQDRFLEDRRIRIAGDFFSAQARMR